MLNVQKYFTDLKMQNIFTSIFHNTCSFWILKFSLSILLILCFSCKYTFFFSNHSCENKTKAVRYSKFPK